MRAVSSDRQPSGWQYRGRVCLPINKPLPILAIGLGRIQTMCFSMRFIDQGLSEEEGWKGYYPHWQGFGSTEVDPDPTFLGILNLIFYRWITYFRNKWIRPCPKLNPKIHSFNLEESEKSVRKKDSCKNEFPSKTRLDEASI